jgi:hypothetical protein
LDVFPSYKVNRLRHSVRCQLIEIAVFSIHRGGSGGERRAVTAEQERW